MRPAPDDLSSQASKANRLLRAIDAVFDLLDPDVEPRSYSDALNLMGAIDLAIEFIRARPEFMDLDMVELHKLHSRALERLNW
jgi:hypothetical protein